MHAVIHAADFRSEAAAGLRGARLGVNALHRRDEDCLCSTYGTCSMTRASRPHLEIVRGALADLARGRAVWSSHGQRGEIKSELTSRDICHIILIFNQSFHKPDEANI